MRDLMFVGIVILVCGGGCGTAYNARRIPAVAAHERIASQRALLVCAYGEKECLGTHLVGGITLEEFETRVSTIPRNQEIILFCG